MKVKELIELLQELDSEKEVVLEFHDNERGGNWYIELNYENDTYSFPGIIDPETVKEWAVKMGSLGGSSKSESKTTASRENGKKGGRPKKD